MLTVRASTLWLTLFAFAACSGCGGGSPPRPRGIEVTDGRRLPVIDMHLHTGSWDRIPPQAQAFLRDALPMPFKLAPGVAVDSILSSKGIVEQLDAAGAEHGVLFAVYAPHSVGVASNELVQARRDEQPERLLALAGVNVERWATDAPARLAELERALLAGRMIGVKLAHPHMHLGLGNPMLAPVYALAGRHQAPVYVHIGNSPGPGVSNERENTDPLFFEAAIRNHPDCTFILGHVGYDFVNKSLGDLDTCVRLALQYPNVLLEASALGSQASDPTSANLVEVYRRFKHEGLVDRVLYGSDGPQRPGFVRDYLDRTVAAMRANTYTDDEMAAVLAGNFERVFRRSLERIGRFPLRTATSGSTP